MFFFNVALRTLETGITHTLDFSVATNHLSRTAPKRRQNGREKQENKSRSELSSLTQLPTAKHKLGDSICDCKDMTVPKLKCTHEEKENKKSHYKPMQLH